MPRLRANRGPTRSDPDRTSRRTIPLTRLLPTRHTPCTNRTLGTPATDQEATGPRSPLRAVAIGTGWTYSLVVTLTGGGEVFYEAATVLAAFVLLGHWFEMRARGGANDAIRSLLELAPEKALVLRDGEPVEVPTAQVAVGDLLLVRPGGKIPVDGRIAGLVGLADTPRPTATAAVAALHDAGVEVVMLTGDNSGTAQRIAKELGVDTVIAEVLPGDKATEIARLQAGGRRVAMVGDGVNDAPALAQADLGIAIGAGTDVAIETADVVLMRSDPLDVPTALLVGRATVRKMRQNLAWAIGYNTVALPIAAGIFEPVVGLTLRPEIAALTMSGSSILVAVNALLLKRQKLPRTLKTQPRHPAR